MADQPQVFYRPSGKFPPYAPFAVLGAGLVTGVVGGMVYGIIDWWVPFIYVLFLATIGLGVGQGFVVLHVLRFLKVRNTAVAVACGLGCGLSSYYGAWVGWVFAGSEWEVLAYHPADLFYIAQATNEVGTWGLVSDTAVKGIFLLLFWVVEAGIIIVPPVVMGWAAVGPPFNEKVQAWADHTESLPPLAPISSKTQDQIGQGLARGDFSVLRQLRPLDHDSATFTSISFAWAPADRDTQFMSINCLALSEDKEGNVKVRKTPVTTHMIVDAESRLLIEEIFAEGQRTLPTQGGPIHDTHAEDAADAAALEEMLED